MALGIIARVFRRPAGWLARRLVGEPAGAWFRQQIHEVMSPAIETVQRELRFNGGGSVKDQVKATADDVQRLSAALAAIAQKPGGQRRTDPPEETP